MHTQSKRFSALLLGVALFVLGAAFVPTHSAKAALCNGGHGQLRSESADIEACVPFDPGEYVEPTPPATLDESTIFLSLKPPIVTKYVGNTAPPACPSGYYEYSYNGKSHIRYCKAFETIQFVPGATSQTVVTDLTTTFTSGGVTPPCPSGFNEVIYDGNSNIRTCASYRTFSYVPGPNVRSVITDVVAYYSSGTTQQCPTGNGWGEYSYDGTSHIRYCSQTKTISVALPEPPLDGLCWASPGNPSTGQQVTWNVSATGGGGSGTYTYDWSGAVTGTGETVTNSYSSGGAKTATVNITSNSPLNQTATRTCSVTVSNPTPLSCTPGTTQTVNTGQPVSFSATGGSGTISWNAPGGSPATGGNNANFSTTYAAAGSNTVTVRRGTATASCNVTVTNPTQLQCSPATYTTVPGTVVSFSRTNGTGPFTWQAPGATPSSGPGSTFSTSWDSTSVGQTKTVTVSDSASHTASCYVDVFQTNNSGVIHVTSNIPATWVINGKATTTQTTLSQDETYTQKPSGSYTLIPDPQANCTSTVSPGATQNLPSGTQTVTFSINYSCTQPVANLACSPQTQSVVVNNPVSFNAGGSTGAFSWSAPGGSPTTGGDSQTFNTTYNTVGSKVVTVYRGTQSDTCNVTVTATPPTTATISVMSNVATTYSITGASTINQTSPVTAWTHVGWPGTYTITPATLNGYPAPTITPSQTQSVGAGNGITFSLNYSTTGGPGPGGGGGTPPSCVPVNSSAAPNIMTWINASGPRPYSWSAPSAPDSANPTDGDFTSFGNSWASNGLKTVTVTNPGGSATCYVSVSNGGAGTNDLPTGYHDGNVNSRCEIDGWATDPDDRSIPLSVKIYSDGTLVKTMTANQYRSDLTGVCLNGNCAFFAPLSGLISNGVAHSITVKGVDAQTGAEQTLAGSPKSITCPVPPADFTIQNSNDISVTVTSGVSTSTQTVLTIAPQNSFGSTVTLSASPAIAGLKYVFGSTSLTSGQFGTGTTFSVVASSTAVSGARTIVITGVGGGLTRSTNVVVNVSKKKPSIGEF